MICFKEKPFFLNGFSLKIKKILKKVLTKNKLVDIILLVIDVREWLSGRASPCQGERREFESRLPLLEKPRS